MIFSRRSLLSGSAAAAAAAVSLPQASSAQSRSFTPEQFGARGDGITNDSRAFARLAQAVNAAGGGTVQFRRTTYLVGEQFPRLKADSLYYFEPGKLLEFVGCTKPLRILGSGAKFKCADRLRYGTFDLSGRPANHPAPYLGPGVASPYWFMIKVENCSGPVEIADIELDGNIARLVIGGEYGDTGRQIPGSGIGLINNRGDEIVRNVHSHHHGQDGVIIDGRDEPAAPLPRRLITRLRCEYNGRQGVSIVGGRGYAFEQCQFNRTGRAGLMSAPGAGVDIEAEGGKKNRDFRFTDCEFVDNAGCGLVADTGDSEGATFTRCTFIGTTAWSAWPFKPRFLFRDCRFVGAMVRAYGDKDPKRATQFHNCTFLDDPKLSPTGKVCMGNQENYPIVDLSDSRNVLFSRCIFRLTAKGLLPWSWFALYQDCRMDQKAKVPAYPKGKYLGTSILNGQVDLYGTNVVGVLVVNGTRIEKRQLGGTSW